MELKTENINPTQRIILLVEDEAIIAMTRKIGLEKYNYTIINAYTGEEAIVAIKRYPHIDLILMDINLGDGLDGTEVAEIILKNYDIPIIFLSSHSEPEIVEKTEKITSYGYVLKNSDSVVLDASMKVVFKLFDERLLSQKSEKKIKFLLSEKELILKEVHHRIKNFMSTINGLLILQARTINNHEAIGALEDASNRMRSMMILYDKLYKSEDFQDVLAEVYFSPLIDDIINNFPNSKLVKIKKSINNFTLNATKLQPIGIIINELLTNIMKYAFSSRDENNQGLINFIAKCENNFVTIIISENGSGIPNDIDFKHPTGFGLTLVKELVGQLNGTINIERENGTKITIEFEK